MRPFRNLLIMYVPLLVFGCVAPVVNGPTIMPGEPETSVPATPDETTDTDAGSEVDGVVQPDELVGDAQEMELPESPASDEAAMEVDIVVDYETACGDLTFEDWSTWTKVNDDLLQSEAHGNQWTDIYVNALAESTYLSAGAPYPECSVVAKSSYRNEVRDPIIGLGIMVKMPAGYDPDNGDWWYGKFHTSGRYAFDEGKLAECIACHKEAAETDFMYSHEVLEAISN